MRNSDGGWLFLPRATLNRVAIIDGLRLLRDGKNLPESTRPLMPRVAAFWERLEKVPPEGQPEAIAAFFA